MENIWSHVIQHQWTANDFPTNPHVHSVFITWTSLDSELNWRTSLLHARLWLFSRWVCVCACKAGAIALIFAFTYRHIHCRNSSEKFFINFEIKFSWFMTIHIRDDTRYACPILDRKPHENSVLAPSPRHCICVKLRGISVQSTKAECISNLLMFWHRSSMGKPRVSCSLQTHAPWNAREISER